ncbi:hypothetical protein KC19_VG231900 [Ceratodon purpureus]|uniref:Uncharacterized protein n=1 Tax=Ceratodon purpureus TaxID=3225 RepID=A0A8T0HT04_CERPU|nr:hypothetical protein KC19_VG231900 [Ceratodon purpureus]
MLIHRESSLPNYELYQDAAKRFTTVSPASFIFVLSVEALHFIYTAIFFVLWQAFLVALWAVCMLVRKLCNLFSSYVGHQLSPSLFGSGGIEVKASVDSSDQSTKENGSPSVVFASLSPWEEVLTMCGDLLPLMPNADVGRVLWPYVQSPLTLLCCGVSRGSIEDGRSLFLQP